jgi:transcriptional regulator
MNSLTDKELEVLKLRKDGRTQAEIAVILAISQPAVSNFERNAKKKIDDANELLQVLHQLGIK